MIIAYYTGSGGHRYLNFVEHKDYTKLGVTYYHDKDKELEYLVPEKTYQQYPIVLTHCLNYNLIRQKFPNDQDITFIIADRKASWCRKYLIKVSQNFISDDEKYQTALNFISELDNYYNKIPIHIGNAKVIDIKIDNSNFSNIMKQELLVYSCEHFERAWNKFYS